MLPAVQCFELGPQREGAFHATSSSEWALRKKFFEQGRAQMSLYSSGSSSKAWTWVSQGLIASANAGS